MKQLPRLIPFPGAPVRDGAPEGADTAAASAIAESADANAATGQRAAREQSLDRALAAVRSRWGYGSIVRLDQAGAPAAGAQHARRPKSTHELPPWWPRPVGPDGAGSVLRPRLLEVVAEPGSGRLTLTLTWLAAARPTLAAIVDTSVSPIWRPASTPNPKSGDPPQRVIQNPKLALERFYPPAAAGAGLDLMRLLVVQPPADDPHAALDTVVILLRSEAFDAILCPLPARARISTSFASKLATLAIRANTSLLLLTQPSPQSQVLSPESSVLNRQSTQDSGLRTGDLGLEASGALAAFADYRVRLTNRRWLWEDGELAGMKLRAATERARATRAASATEDAARGTVAHDLTFRLHRQVRHGAGAADHLSLTTSTRLPHAAEDQATEENVLRPLALAGSRSS